MAKTRKPVPREYRNVIWRVITDPAFEARLLMKSKATVIQEGLRLPIYQETDPVCEAVAEGITLVGTDQEL